MIATRLYHLAKCEAFERVPETCPAVHSGGTEAVAKFNQWLNRTAWIDKLSQGEAARLETRIGELVADVIDAAKTAGTRPLREALIGSIHEHYLICIPADRLEAIEAGKDTLAEVLSTLSTDASSHARV